MAKIFLSYRRTDSSQVAGRLYDRLASEFGSDAVFKDVDSIPIGLDFRKQIDRSVHDCDVFIAIIGEEWLNASSDGENRRIHDSSDIVRLEIEAALKRGIPLIPVLIDNAVMPQMTDLPPSIHELSFRNAIRLRADPDFHRDADRLISGIKAVASHVRSRQSDIYFGIAAVLFAIIGGYLGFQLANGFWITSLSIIVGATAGGILGLFSIAFFQQFYGEAPLESREPSSTPDYVLSYFAIVFTIFGGYLGFRFGNGFWITVGTTLLGMIAGTVIGLLGLVIVAGFISAALKDSS